MELKNFHTKTCLFRETETQREIERKGGGGGMSVFLMRVQQQHILFYFSFRVHTSVATDLKLQVISTNDISDFQRGMGDNRL